MSKKDVDNYIKDVQEGDIIDPGHLREMNILAFLGNLPEFDELMGGMDSEKCIIYANSTI